LKAGTKPCFLLLKYMVQKQLNTRHLESRTEIGLVLDTSDLLYYHFTNISPAYIFSLTMNTLVTTF